MVARAELPRPILPDLELLDGPELPPLFLLLAEALRPVPPDHNDDLVALILTIIRFLPTH